MALLRQLPVLIQPGALRTSAARTIPAVSHDITIQMTDTGDWATVTGNVLIWGWQLSTDGGATWTWKQWQPGRADPTQFATDGVAGMPFGTVGKNGLLPSMRISGADVLANANDRARLAIAVDTAITVGADITTA